MHRHLTLLTLAASLTLALLPPAAFSQSAEPAGSAPKAGSVAYPANPSGTPQAENKGEPVVTDKAACASGTKCPDKPPVSAEAAPGEASGGIKTPSTAYPDSPVKTPAAEPTGTAPN